jgi:hypothetical protein
MASLEKTMSIKSFIATFVAKRKAAAAIAVVDAYVGVISTHATQILPVMLAGYQTLATTIIAKTDEDPAPLLAFVDALAGLHAHYGESVASAARALHVRLNDIEPDMRSLRAAVNAYYD